MRSPRAHELKLRDLPLLRGFIRLALPASARIETLIFFGIGLLPRLALPASARIETNTWIIQLYITALALPASARIETFEREVFLYIF